jgi:uncharacterized protein YprB with RNaseH-like and TPR domain
VRALRDRLRDTVPARPALLPQDPGLEPLAALERRLLGTAATGLPLRHRLERLVRVAVRERGAPRAEPLPARRAVPLEEVVPGARVIENARGRCVLVEEDLPLDRRHGDVSLSRFRALLPATLAVLAGDPAPEAYASFAAERTAFLDTETTGLAGGPGTAAFLVGVAFVRGDVLRLRQYVMRDYDEEPALLEAVAGDLREVTHLVTFNGRGFDVPLLEARFRLNRARMPLAAAVHLDLLPPVRRLWGERFESCRLQALEAELLGLRRHGDVPGEEIPGLYFDYLRSRNARGLAPVLEHNRLDVVSLAALLAFCCGWIEEGEAEDPRDHYGLARVFERAAVHERCEAHYRQVVEGDAGPLRLSSLRRLAARAKRARDHQAALPLWEQAAASGEWWALRELAIHHEHRSRDLDAARAAVEEALRRAGGRLSSRLHDDLLRRRRRVLSKLSARRA